jgi:dienelactone hydrolase
MQGAYDPFTPGSHVVAVRTFQARDKARDRVFPVEVWHPETSVNNTLIVFSHASGHNRRGATFLCTYLGSHGYLVAAMDHSEVVATQPPVPDETAEQKAARMEAVIASRMPDVPFLLDFLRRRDDISFDHDRIGIVGHSFGAWTALTLPDSEPAVDAVVALAAGGESIVKPGILSLKVRFPWGREVPTLYLGAEYDTMLPITGMYETFERTPGIKQAFVLRRADHMHFMDNVEQQHEGVRLAKWPEEMAWISQEMRPISELCSGEQAHLFTRSLTLAHFDAYLRQNEDARRFLSSEVIAELAARGIDAISAPVAAYPPRTRMPT